MSETRGLCLALQGGGAHGAFEWGVLDALLEDARFAPRGASGASAGAMNAVVLAHGLLGGGVASARAALEQFWRAVSNAGPHNPFGSFDAANPLWDNGLTRALSDVNPFLKAAQAMADSFAGGQSLAFSPYQFNPFNLNPLRDALTSVVDFERLRRDCPIALFVAATAVKTGRSVVFKGREIGADHILASACLPYLFQAVEIDGEPYWDGGFLANPPLWPLFYGELPRDVLVVNLNPFTRASAPHDVPGILDRLNEISFNATLLSELRAVAFVNRLVEDNLLNAEGHRQYQPVRVHMIRADGFLDDLPMTSKFNTDWGFLCDLRDRGRTAAQQWLEAHGAAVGRHSSVDVRSEFL